MCLKTERNKRMKNKLQIAIPVFAVCFAVVFISGKPNTFFGC